MAEVYGGKHRWFKPGRLTAERLQELLRAKLANAIG
jgi:hypothetical protein